MNHLQLLAERTEHQPHPASGRPRTEDPTVTGAVSCLGSTLLAVAAWSLTRPAGLNGLDHIVNAAGAGLVGLFLVLVTWPLLHHAFRHRPPVTTGLLVYGTGLWITVIAALVLPDVVAFAAAPAVVLGLAWMLHATQTADAPPPDSSSIGS